MSTHAAPRQAVFLVGGLGTRLGELTRHTPKPLMDIAGRPFLMWLAEAVVAQGVSRLLFLCGYLAPQIEAASEALKASGVEVVHSIEPQPLGTGGALAFARDQLEPEFFLLNGDSLFHVPLQDLAATRGEPDGVLGRLALRREADASRYGAVRLEGERLVAFEEKQAQANPGLINGGVYWLRRDLLGEPPAGAFSLERDLFPKLARRGLLQGRIYDAAFIDIGLPASLRSAQSVVPQALNRPPG